MINEKYKILSKTMKEYASFFREIGPSVELDSTYIHEFINHDVIKTISRMNIPKEYNDYPLRVKGYEFYGETCLEKVIAIEALAYGDLGILLACPGASLSGQVINDFADLHQKDSYYSKLLEKPTWTFFALTEPHRGSDASNIQTNINYNKAEDKYLLNGEKYFIGNGCRGEVGVVFCKGSSEGLDLKVLLIEPKDRGNFTATKLDTIGVKGAELSHLVFNDYEVSQEQFLGNHLSPLKRGLWGAITTFNKMRPGIAAMGVGLSQSVVDYLKEVDQNPNITRENIVSELQYLINSLRSLVYETAIKIDENPIKNGYMSSIAKLQSINVTNKVISESFNILGSNSMINHPVIEKIYRDSKAIEFMEGTSNIQKGNIFQNYAKGRYKLG